jgi:hypothetical protein
MVIHRTVRENTRKIKDIHKSADLSTFPVDKI